MKRDPFYQQLLHGLSQPLDTELFERCMADILRREWPTLVPVRGGGDAGMDGAIADEKGTAFPLVSTTGTDVIGNLTRSLTSYIKQGGKRRRVLLATSQELTPKRRQNLEKRAKEKGFTLLQIYTQAAVADRLYRDPAWCRELLNLTGSPPALSVIPLTARPLLDIDLVGREADSAWLTSQQHDCLLVGQPGSGKTFLLHDLAKKGIGLFVVGEERGEIVAALREQQPPALILDDAHVHLELLTRLRQIRQETGLAFTIIACCWPGQQDEVREILTLSPSQLHTLKLLTRDEILAIIKSVGIYGSDELLRELVDQAEGRPGLAVTLAHLCLQGAVQEVALGDALSRSIRTTFEPLVGREAAVLLAGFAVGGRSGLPMMAVADACGLPLLQVQRMVAQLAAGGVIQQMSGECLAVRPAGLRHALVRDVFFCGALSLPLEPYLAQARKVSDAVHTLLGARARGAAVPDELLLPLLTHLSEKELWAEYAFLGQRETLYVLRTGQVPIAQFAEAALYHAPEETISRLLEEASADKSPAAALESIKKWMQEAEPGTGKAVPRRRVVVRSVRDWLTREDMPHTSEAPEGKAAVAVQALAYALSPKFEWTSMDPGRGNTLTITRGILSVTEAREMRVLWNEAFQLLGTVPPIYCKKIMDAIDDWVYPQRHGVGEAHPELTQAMHDLAHQMVGDLTPLLSEHPGFLTEMKKLAEHLGLAFPWAIDEDFAALFPSRSFEDWRKEEEEQTAGIQALAQRWKQRDARVAASQLKQFEAEADNAGLSWPRLVPQFCYELAPHVENSDEWAQAFAEIGLPAHYTRPFLDEAVTRRQGNWEQELRDLLNNPVQCGAALIAILKLNDPPPDLLNQALGVAEGFLQHIETCCLRDEIPLSTVKRLLHHEQPAVATATAMGIWLADQRSIIPEELWPDWKQAILNTREDDYWLGEILSADPALAEQWLRTRLAEKREPYERLSDATQRAIAALDEATRINLLPLLPDSYSSMELVTWLVGTSLTLFACLLQIPHLASYHLVPLASSGENMSPMIVQALDAGFAVSEVAAALHPISWSCSGEESLMWQQWADRFGKLHDDPDGRVGQVAQEAREIALQGQKRAQAREQAEAIYGRNQ